MVRLLHCGSLAFLAVGLWVGPSQAHTVKASDSVAVTFHLEPDHNPRAGDPAQVWFVLTQKGGSTIPLSQCNCHLQVIAEENGQTIAQPPLTAVSAEQYQNIPGADVTFPKPGAYQLSIQGQPQTGDAFQPFQFSFPVTVAKGSSPKPSPPVQSIDTPLSSSKSDLPKVAWISISIGAGLSFVMLVLRLRKNSK
ncbi:hypothetical protein [Acaryochloris sp. CCMEE 5410]|uniref:hypothetical protein n=1 Tax=Acaryochloris sp. CCMEE 5410 TaxID=310037 RepID=UPI000248493F|nr:hypothetical protein [Acaryochloris sp. CCMEE 5410]KAI9131662.1 hypothetical protein ON05_029205 [Acaryochloris sp. CCMEE 5410]